MDRTYRIVLANGQQLEYKAKSRQEAFDAAVDLDLIDREEIIAIKRIPTYLPAATYRKAATYLQAA
jgi:hypothetical protein